MGFKLLDRAMSFLTYQRKRVMRRKIEARLRALGVYGDEVGGGPFQRDEVPQGHVYLWSI